ncbi:hypothetical protein ACC691_36240, partial [Rhizobium johnstonii]
MAVGASSDPEVDIGERSGPASGRGAVIRAYLFDLDGVLTPTAEVHRRAWRALFEPYLSSHGVTPYTEADYFAHIDGKPRYDGVRDLLASLGWLAVCGPPLMREWR